MPDDLPDDPTAAVADALTLLCEIEAADLEDGTTRDLARRLDLVNRIQAWTTDATWRLQTVLAERMEDDYQSVEGVGWLVRSPRYSTAGSDNKGAQDAARLEISRRLALDHETGEMRGDWRHVAESAVDLMARCISLGAPKSGFREVLGLDADDYVSRHQSGWKVEVQERP